MHRWVHFFLLLLGWLLLQNRHAIAATVPAAPRQSPPFPTSNHATHLADYTPLALATLVDGADLIVRGRVTATRSFWSVDHSIIESEVTIAVAYTLLGNPMRTVTVHTPGGYLATEGIGMVSYHAATFTVGEEVLAFAYQHGADWQIVNGATGKFLIEGDRVVNADLALAQPIHDLLPAVVDVVKQQGGKAQLPMAWRYVQASAQPASVQPIKVENGAHKWSTLHPTVTYRININTAQIEGDNGDGTAFQTAILAAATSWSTVVSADFTLLYAGKTEATKTSYNGVNEVLFMHKGRKERAAAAQVWYTTNQTIVEADIWINEDYVWNATGTLTAPEVDLQSALLHEFGHWLVLGHFSDTTAVMFPRLTAGTLKRELQEQDVLGISAIYPR